MRPKFRLHIPYVETAVVSYLCYGGKSAESEVGQAGGCFVCVSRELESPGFEPWRGQQIYIQNLQTGSGTRPASYSLRTVVLSGG
jgi:hypothetical protein